MQSILMMDALDHDIYSEAPLFGSMLGGAWRKRSPQQRFFLGRLESAHLCSSQHDNRPCTMEGCCSVVKEDGHGLLLVWLLQHQGELVLMGTITWQCGHEPEHRNPCERCTEFHATSSTLGTFSGQSGNTQKVLPELPWQGSQCIGDYL